MIKRTSIKNIYHGTILFIMLKPESIEYLSEYASVQWTRLRYIAFVLVIISALLRINKIHRHNCFFPVISILSLYGLSLLLGSITTEGSSVVGALHEEVRLLTMFFLCFILYDMGWKNLCNVFISIYFLYATINLLSILIWPEGIYTNEWGYRSNYFLGAKNVFILYLLPWFTFILFKEQNSGRKLFHYFCFTIGIISSVLVGSASNILILSLVIIWVVFKDFFIAHNKLLNARNYIILTVAIFIVIVIVQNISIFSWLIEGVLHKDITMTSRTGIWNSILLSISKKPFFGYGILSGDRIITITQNSLGINAHNMYLWALFRGGILNLASIILLLLYAGKLLSMNNNAAITSGLSWGMFLLMTAWMVEIHSLVFMVPIILLPIFTSEQSIATMKKKRISLVIRRRL